MILGSFKKLILNKKPLPNIMGSPPDLFDGL